ncbi:hypothetical protein VTN96DRAFT_2691 [Rasamsonia emersonii]
MRFNVALALLLASGPLTVLAAPMPQQQDGRNGVLANVDKAVNDAVSRANDVAAANGGTPQLTNVPGVPTVLGDTGAVAPTGSDKGKSRRQLPLDALGSVTGALGELGGVNPLGQGQGSAGSASHSPQFSRRQAEDPEDIDSPEINVPGVPVVVGDKGKNRRQSLDASGSLSGTLDGLGGVNPLGEGQGSTGSASPSPQLSRRQAQGSGSDTAPSTPEGNGSTSSSPLGGSPLGGSPLGGSSPLSGLGL